MVMTTGGRQGSVNEVLGAMEPDAIHTSAGVGYESELEAANQAIPPQDAPDGSAHARTGADGSGRPLMSNSQHTGNVAGKAPIRRPVPTRPHVPTTSND